MISKTLTFLTSYLNQEMTMLYGFSQDTEVVVASSLVSIRGGLNSDIDNKIVISIINIERESTVKAQVNHITRDGNSMIKIAQPMVLNLYLLVSANYSSENYIEASKILSSIISLFNSTSYFTREKYPSMEAPIEKLTMEIYNVPVTELNHIWNGIGANYVPSIVYKVRMVGIQERGIKERTPAIKGLDGNAKKQ
ncbi:DUF4255 domain-containing protein [Winogradskyella sp.]|uniref:DUF4255 domain-containing protein n=1 Tax=Winogradskyella sp. TaxID=1883156 RepID=UPI0025D4EDBF|nr:DUF4255 domain-containing protein [Winogradskyella sp.]